MSGKSERLLKLQIKFIILSSGGTSSTKQCTNRTVEREDSSEKVASHVKNLKREVERLRKQLSQSTTERKFKYFVIY